MIENSSQCLEKYVVLYFIRRTRGEEKKEATLQISKISNLPVALGMFLLILVCCHSVWFTELIPF